jgi:hypothetical protein
VVCVCLFITSRGSKATADNGRSSTRIADAFGLKITIIALVKKSNSVRLFLQPQEVLKPIGESGCSCINTDFVAKSRPSIIYAKCQFTCRKIHQIFKMNRAVWIEIGLNN